MSTGGKLRGVARLIAGSRATVSPSYGSGDVTVASLGHRIMDEGVAVTDRPDLDFQGAGVTVTDDAGNVKTIVTIPGGGGAGGGSGTGGALFENMMKQFDPNADPVDKLLILGPYRIFVFYSSHNAASWKSPTNAKYTVPTGMKLLIMAQGGAVLGDSTSRQARLRNTTDGADVLAPTRFNGVKEATSALVADHILAEWTGDLATASKLVEVAAGKALELQIWNSDGNKRAMGAWVIARLVTSANATLSGELASSWKTRNLINTTNTATPNSKVDIKADEITVEDTVLTTVSQTVDMTVAGAGGLDTGAEAANTWYAIWLIYNPETDTTKGLFSTSFTAPTMPSGYTKKRLVGAVRNDGSSNFLTFFQIGDKVYYIEATTTTHTILNAGAAAVFTTVSAATYAPSISRRAIVGSFGSAAAVDARTRLTGSGVTNGRVITDAVANSTIYSELDLDTSQQFDYKVNSGNVTIIAEGYYIPVL